MTEPEALRRVTVGVSVPAKHLSWLTRAVTARGGEVALSLQAARVSAARHPEGCPLTEAELDAVRAVIASDTWEAAAAEAMLSVAGLRARLKAAQRRLGVESDGRLVTICLATDWVPVPPGIPRGEASDMGGRRDSDD